MTDKISRRHLFQGIAAMAGLFGIQRLQAMHTETHFEDTTNHKIVYQCNKADPDYLQHVFFSVGELLRKYGDDIHIVVAAFGQGIHVLGQNPGRPVPKEIQERVKSLAAYGVQFHACGNTMKSLGWSEIDIHDFAKVVPIGVEDIMLLQEQGFAYFSW